MCGRQGHRDTHALLMYEHYPLYNFTCTVIVFETNVTIEMVLYTIDTMSAFTLCLSLQKCIRFHSDYCYKTKLLTVVTLSLPVLSTAPPLLKMFTE